MKKVLILEDEENIRSFVVINLRRAGYEVVEAGTGQEALDKLMANPDTGVAILDVMLPELDGYEFTRTWREGGNDLPILMVSAKQLPTDKHRGFAAGTDDYITKPIDSEEMLFRVKALLRRAKIASERRMVIGEVVLDYDAMTVSRAGVSIELPQKEFLLLYKLLSFPGKIFTRIQLMDEIWGADSETGWETVTVHIGRLRRRFEGWGEFEIQSVRGLGYKAVKRV